LRFVKGWHQFFHFFRFLVHWRFFAFCELVQLLEFLESFNIMRWTLSCDIVRGNRIDSWTKISSWGNSEHLYNNFPAQDRVAGISFRQHFVIYTFFQLLMIKSVPLVQIGFFLDVIYFVLSVLIPLCSSMASTFVMCIIRLCSSPIIASCFEINVFSLLALVSSPGRQSSSPLWLDCPKG